MRYPRAVTRTSQISGLEHTMMIPMTEEEWQEVQGFITDRFNSRKIQDILPFHSADEREFVLSGVTPAEWHDAFGDPDDAA